jgi:hypothetical protein
MSELEDCSMDLGYEDMMVAKVMHQHEVRPTSFGPGHLVHYLDPDGIREFHKGFYSCNEDYHHLQGDRYFYGLAGFQIDAAAAVAEWEKGEEAGNIQCMKNLVWVYDSGAGGVKRQTLRFNLWRQRLQEQERPSEPQCGIHDEYRHRYLTNYKDEQDNSTYLLAAQVFTERNYRTAIDVGLHDKSYMREFGAEEDFDEPDMIICANVIERHPRPEKLLREIKAKYPGACLVLATPNRAVLSTFCLTRWCGPPFSMSRYREWSLDEFDDWTNDIFGKSQRPYQLRGRQMNMAKVIDV